jgi:carboxyl-terminal processing protease
MIEAVVRGGDHTDNGYRSHPMRLYWTTAWRFVNVLALVGSLPLNAPLHAQTIGGYERDRGRIMLRVVRQHLEEHYYDSTFHGVDLRAAAARADSQIQIAQSNAQIFSIIADFVQALDDSHTGFIPPRRAADVDYGWKLQMIGDSCYVVRVEPGSDAAVQGLAIGDRVIAVERYPPSRHDLPLLMDALDVVSPRPVVRFDLETPDGSLRTLNLQAKLTERPRTAALSEVVRELELSKRPPLAETVTLGTDVLVLRLGWFSDRSDMDRAMARARKVGILILDLRGNAGGLEDGLVRLVGEVLDRPIRIGTIRRRHDMRPLESKPAGHPFTGRLFVLIDSGSASSSEIFARVIQLNGRGVVLGDRSAGAVMRSRLYDLVMGADVQTFYALSVTDADLIMPDGARLEGRGVQPDTVVLPTAVDLATGRDPVLAAALTMAGYPMDASRAGTLLPRRGEKR